MSRGALRFTEDQFRDHAAKRDRFKTTAAMPATLSMGAPSSDHRLCSDPSIPTLTDAVTGGVWRPLERDVLEVVIEAMRAHTRIGWAARMNTGALKVGTRFVRFGFPGLSDVIGQTRDGRMVAVEVKRPGRKPTPIQESFLSMVREWGGIAFCATCVGDVIEGLR